MPVASIEAGDLCKVHDIKTLGKVRDAEARNLLEKISKQVQPIMRKRRWRVLLLSEFCPANRALLGLNIGGGQEVRIRLRRSDYESEFLPYEDLLGTMLHELTHNEHGAHDAKFYKLLDEITKECEDLMTKGITGTGQGFDAPGRRLGGYRHDPPSSSIRQAALAAAERRARSNALMPAGPHRLGGDSVIMKALSPVQAAAMAAERRLRDDIWCGAPETVGKDGLQKAQEKELGVSSSGVRSVGNDLKLDTEAETSQSKGHVSGDAIFPTNLPGSSQKEEKNQAGILLETEGMWDCNLCTFSNPPLALVCGACMGQRKEIRKTWMCKFCTLENPLHLDNCVACNQWRYSFGAPVSTRGYIGT